MLKSRAISNFFSYLQLFSTMHVSLPFSSRDSVKKYQGMGCDRFLRRTHAPRTSRFQCARTRVRTFILWWSHFAPARAPFLLKIKFRGYFYSKKTAENMEAIKNIFV